MKKAVEITKITIENGTATVTYVTGTVRKYAEGKLPKTVLSWMAAHQEATEAPAEEPSTEELTGFVLVDTPTTGFVLIEAPEEPTVTALVPVAMTTTLVPVTVDTDGTVDTSAELTMVIDSWVEAETEAAEDAAEAIRVTSEALRAQAIKEATETATKAAKAITKAAKVAVKAAKAVAENAPEVAKRAAVGAAWTMDKLVDLYYWVTTYLPIAARWLAVHLIWTIQGAIPVVQKSVRTIAGATRKAVKAARIAGLGVARAASAAAGWGLVAVLAGVSISIKIARMAAEGWKLREEIINERRRAA